MPAVGSLTSEDADGDGDKGDDLRASFSACICAGQRSEPRDPSKKIPHGADKVRNEGHQSVLKCICVGDGDDEVV